MKKGIKILLIVIISLAALVALIIGGYNAYLRIAFRDFYSAAEAHGNVPGIADGFIHQGISYLPDSGEFIACGYMKDGSASRIYIFNESGERYVTLNGEDGKPTDTHTGGLSYWAGFVFLTDGDRILVYDLSSIQSKSKESGSVTPVAAFDVNLKASFCYVEGNDLYVGEFYREQNYKTDSSHHLTTPSGDKHHALMVTFDLESMIVDGFTEIVPKAAYSIPDLAQGVCITDSGRICISTSYAVAPSHILVYSAVTEDEQKDTFEFAGKLLPLTYLDSKRLESDIKFFPMSEELVNLDGRVYIMNESASAKYIFGKLIGGNKLYSIKID